MNRRLYLDAADLFDIGDDRIDRVVVKELCAAMAETRTMLLVSHQHLHDSVRGGPRSTESLVRAVEAFEPVLVVTKGPLAVEPLAPGSDIVLDECADYCARVLTHDTAASVFAAQGFDERIHAAQVEKQTALAGLKRGARRTADERKRILNGAGNFLATAVALAKESGFNMTEVVLPAAFDADPASWPGQHLSARIARTRRRDWRRRPRRSDWTDIDHALHFPYVDVATCDANVGDVVVPMLRKMKCPRKPAIVRNGRLEKVVLAVYALGSAAD